MKIVVDLTAMRMKEVNVMDLRETLNNLMSVRSNTDWQKSSADPESQ